MLREVGEERSLQGQGGAENDRGYLELWGGEGGTSEASVRG